MELKSYLFEAEVSRLLRAESQPQPLLLVTVPVRINNCVLADHIKESGLSVVFKVSGD